MSRASAAPYRIWGSDHDAAALEQMQNACALPVAVAGALMPDAHVGYGLPIGGVLATENAVIPYAVGVDIACRMKMTVLDLPVTALSEQQARLTAAIERETRFGVGATFKARRQHDVMDADWKASRLTAGLKDKAWSQLGTSGSGNHFVEFGALTVTDAAAGLAPGEYLALLSHSGSRGSGRDDRAALQQGGASGASRAAAGAVAPRLARPVVRGRPRILAGDGADGRLRGGEPRPHPPARRAQPRRRGAARPREPSQLRVARAARAAGWPRAPEVKT